MKWYLDSDCSRYMTEGPNLFATLSSYKGGMVTFEDDGKGKIIGTGTIGKKHFPTLENVLLVDGLKTNLISVNQLCDKGMNVIFRPSKCIIIDREGNLLFEALKNENVYTIDIIDLTNQSVKCLVALEGDSWLWHKRLGHANFDLISKLSNKRHTRTFHIEKIRGNL